MRSRGEPIRSTRTCRVDSLSVKLRPRGTTRACVCRSPHLSPVCSVSPKPSRFLMSEGRNTWQVAIPGGSQHLAGSDTGRGAAGIRRSTQRSARRATTCSARRSSQSAPPRPSKPPRSSLSSDCVTLKPRILYLRGGGGRRAVIFFAVIGVCETVEIRYRTCQFT